VLLDIALPKLDGLSVLRRLRERKSRIPVLMLTARDTLEDRVTGLDLGADDYMTKPFDLPEFVRRRQEPDARRPALRPGSAPPVP
jgi:two-component system OmpR family response regulator